MSKNSYGTFVDSLNSNKTELRSLGEATGAGEVTLSLYSNDITKNVSLDEIELSLIVFLLTIVSILLCVYFAFHYFVSLSHEHKLSFLWVVRTL